MSESDRGRSARGEQYLDDRTELAYVYDGAELIAKLYEEDLVKEFEDCGWCSVTRTPAGDQRV